MNEDELKQIKADMESFKTEIENKNKTIEELTSSLSQKNKTIEDFKELFNQRVDSISNQPQESITDLVKQYKKGK